MSVTWKLELTIDGSTVDLFNYNGENLVLDESFRPEFQSHRDLEPVQDRLRWSVQARTSLSSSLLALDASDTIPVVWSESTDGGSTWTPLFTGILRPLTEYAVTGSADSWIEMEAVDNGWRMDQSPSGSYRKRDVTVNTIIADILDAAGYSSSEANGPDYGLPVTIPVFEWQADEKSFQQILTDLIQPRGYVYVFDEAGQFQLYDILTVGSPVATVSESSVLGQLSVKRSSVEFEVDANPAVEVNWYELRTVAGKNFVSSENDADVITGYISSGTLESGDDVLDASGSIVIESFNGERAELYDISNAYIEYIRSGQYETWFGQKSFSQRKRHDVQPLTDTSDNVAAVTLDIANAEWSVTWQWDQIVLIQTGAAYELNGYMAGDVTYIAKAGSVTVPDTVPDGVTPKKIANKNVLSQSDAEALAEWLYARDVESLYEYSWRSESDYNLNDIVTISNAELNISTTARIVYKSRDVVRGIYTYRAESSTAPSSLAVLVTEDTGGLITTGDIAVAVTAAGNGLATDGGVKRAIDASQMDETTPGDQGLWITSEYMGYYDIGDDTSVAPDWNVYIRNNGDFRFGGRGNNEIAWDGSELSIIGAATISGTIKSGDGIESSDYVAGSSGWRIDGDGDAEFSNATIRGTIEATTGAIAGWNIGATTIESTDGAVEIDSSLRRVQINDAIGVTKAALGYLSGVADYESTDFGFYVGAGASVGFSSGATFDQGNYLINSDAAFIAESGGIESVRLGSLGAGDIGLDIGGMQFGPVLGGGGATGTFETTVTGGGGATGTFEAFVSGGGNARYGTSAGLLYSLADDRLYLTGTLVGVDGEFSGSLKAATGTFSGALEAATGTFAGELSAATGTFSGELSAATGTFSGLVSGGAIDIGSGNFTVESSGNVVASNIDITGGNISGEITMTGGVGTIDGNQSVLMRGASLIFSFDGWAATDPYTLSNDSNYLNLKKGSSFVASFLDTQIYFNPPVNFLNGTIIMGSLPTSNPGFPGQLWNDAGTLKVCC